MLKTTDLVKQGMGNTGQPMIPALVVTILHNYGDFSQGTHTDCDGPCHWGCYWWGQVVCMHSDNEAVVVVLNVCQRTSRG